MIEFLDIKEGKLCGHQQTEIFCTKNKKSLTSRGEGVKSVNLASFKQKEAGGTKEEDWAGHERKGERESPTPARSFGDVDDKIYDLCHQDKECEDQLWTEKIVRQAVAMYPGKHEESTQKRLLWDFIQFGWSAWCEALERLLRNARDKGWASKD